MDRRLLLECVETMREEDCELTEARDFQIDPTTKQLLRDARGSILARKSGFAVISASRDDKFIAHHDLLKKILWLRRQRALQKAAGKPRLRGTVTITPDEFRAARNKNTRKLKQDLYNSGWVFRPSYGGYVSPTEKAGGGEHGFIVYPMKYDRKEHRLIGRDFFTDDEERRNWERFKEDMIALGKKYSQENVYFAEPQSWHADESTRHYYIASTDHVDSSGVHHKAGDVSTRFDGVRQTLPTDEFFTNTQGRTGRTEQTRTGFIGHKPREQENNLAKIDKDRLLSRSFTGFF